MHGPITAGKKNHIRSILDEEGTLWTKPEDIDMAFVSYFRSIFTTAMPYGIEESIADISVRVTDDMNLQLLREFTGDEVDYVLSQMHPMKVPRLDGFSACFFQKHWATVGGERERFVQLFSAS